LPILQKLTQIGQMDECWSIPPDGYVYIEPDLIRQLNNYKQTDVMSKESGGLLLGYFAEQHLHVVKATTPFSKDKKNRHRFYRRDPMHVEVAKRCYRNSNGLLNVLGEWHTHPENNPTPSSIDLNQWNNIQKTRGKLQTLFMIIGREYWWLGIGLNSYLNLSS